MRRPRDFYETGSWQVAALTDHLPELAGVVWSPALGTGRSSRACGSTSRISMPSSRMISTRRGRRRAPGRHARRHLGDDGDYHGRPDWIITNPPFGAAFAILQHAVATARQGVVIMARLSFMEPTHQRGPWLAAHPCDKRITLERDSFTENGKSDNVTTEWLAWARVPLAGPANVTAHGYKTPARRCARQLHLLEGDETLVFGGGGLG